MTHRSTGLAPFGAALMVPVLLAVTPASVTPPVDGISYTWRQTSSAKGVQPMEMQIRVLEQRARIDYQKAPAGMPPGTWMLIDADSGNVTMVNPKEKTATVFPVGGMLSVLGSMLGSSGIMKAEFSDVSVSATDLGPGEPILDIPTHKHNVTQSYTARVSVIGIRREVKVRSSMDIWVATNIGPAETRAMEAFARNFAGAFGNMGGFGGDGLRKLQEELLRVMPRGVHLKQVTTTLQEQGKKVDTSTTTAEAINFHRGPMEPTVFQVPSGYTIANMSASMQGLEAQRAAAKAECEKEKGVGQCEDAAGVNCDSVRQARADSAREAARQGAADATARRTLGRLGGLLGRRSAPDTTSKQQSADSAARNMPC